MQTNVKKVLLSALIIVALSLTGALGFGCSTAPKTAEGKASIRSEAEAALAKAESRDETLKPVLASAVGYAVFPTVGKGAVGIGGAYGKGVLYEGGRFAGYCDLTQASIGFQLGGQAYTEIVAFMTEEALSDFKGGRLAFSAQATAVAVKAGAGANADYADGVAVFTMGEAGLMYEASIGGQAFTYESE